MMDGGQPTAESVERAIRELGAGPPEQALADLTAVANRAVIELHRLARQQATQHRGEPDWGKWARLANAVRGTVLQVAAIRDSVKLLGLQPGATGAAGGKAQPATAAEPLDDAAPDETDLREPDARR